MDAVIDNDFDTPDFSAKTSYYLAYASQCAYEEHGDWTRKLGLGDQTTVFTCGQFHGFVGFLNRATLLAFRGTQTVGNWLTDAEIPLVSDPAYPGRVHLGFAEAVAQLWPEIRRLLGNPSRAMPLWVTGHSLGGAMATLASVRLTSEGYQVRAVYTYGSPRVGDRNFRDCYERPNYRFVNHNDLVPHLPFRWCYKHVGHVKLLDHQGKLHEGTAAWKSSKRRLRGKAKRVHRAHRDSAGCDVQISGFDWFSDHQIAKYLDAIQKLLPQMPHRRRLCRHLGISEADFIKAFSRQGRTLTGSGS